MQCRMPGVRTGGVRARARARPTHRCPFCEKLYRRLDHYQAHLHHAHEAELDRAAEWEGAPAEASGMSTTDEGTHDVFKHPDRPIRTSPIPAADVAASGAGDSATAHYTAMLDFVSSVIKPILRNIAPDSGVYVAALEEYQRALRAHEECTPRLHVRKHESHDGHRTSMFANMPLLFVKITAMLVNMAFMFANNI